MRTFTNGILVAVLGCLTTNLLTVVMSAPLEDVAPRARVSRSVTNEEEAMDYLKHYSYMAEDGDFWASLEYFQRMADINQTGILDETTMAMMNMPRCGNSEHMGNDHRARKRRFDAVRRWPEDEITWRINSFTNDLSQTDTTNIIRGALEIWSDEANIRFTEVPGSQAVDFNIEFVTRSHGNEGIGDGPFDGPGQTLAHAFLPSGIASPSLAGDAHFDDDEMFTQNINDGINLFQVAAHEFGHSLGLGHSDVQDALMYPFYRGFIANYQLNTDDIAGIRTLYGANVDEPDQTMKPYPETQKPDVPPSCPGNNIDAFATTNDGRLFALEGNQIWQIEQTGVVAGFPRSISEVFPNLPDDVDAGLYYSFNGLTYFFKGSQYYEYSGTNYRSTGSIASTWRGVPNDIDAAFVWSGNGKTYFVKDNLYYRFNSYRGKVDRGYPNTLDVWNLRDDNGDPLPSLNAAMQWDFNSRTYFFTADRYYRFDDRRFNVDMNTDYPYPRSTAFWWFGCDSEQSYQQDGPGGTGNNVVATSAVMLALVAFFTRTLL